MLNNSVAQPSVAQPRKKKPTGCFQAEGEENRLDWAGRCAVERNAMQPLAADVFHSRKVKTVAAIMIWLSAAVPYRAASLPKAAD